MTLPAPSGRRAGLQFTVLSFPVRIDVSFVVVMALLGLTGAASVGEVVVWVLMGAAAVLAHELGHALVARTTGARPSIELYSFGGLTSYAPPGPISRARSLAISVTGPLVGIVIGLAVLALVAPGDPGAPRTLGVYARDAAVFTNLGWGLLNLLPVLPLDGGHALAELLPGEPAVRARRAAVVSVPVAVALAAYAFSQQYLFGALLAGWLGFDNLRTVMASRVGDEQRRLPPPAGPSPADRDALWLVDQGRAEQARHLLTTLPADQRVDPAVQGLVLALTGRVERGAPLVRQAHAQAPDDPLRTGAYARLLLAERDWPGLADLVSRSGDRVPVELVMAGQEAALGAGAARGAAALGELALPRAGAWGPSLARRTAVAWTRTGRPDEALRALGRAADLGALDGAGLAALDDDPELAPVRALPGYPDLRVRAGEGDSPDARGAR